MKPGPANYARYSHVIFHDDKRALGKTQSRKPVLQAPIPRLEKSLERACKHCEAAHCWMGEHRRTALRRTLRTIILMKTAYDRKSCCRKNHHMSSHQPLECRKGSGPHEDILHGHSKLESRVRCLLQSRLEVQFLTPRFPCDFMVQYHDKSLNQHAWFKYVMMPCFAHVEF